MRTAWSSWIRARQPFAVIADDSGRKGYLRVAPAVALPVSHFDVGGETVVDGLKGHLYGDRGVWRPGDTIYLTFALQDRAKTLPAESPGDAGAAQPARPARADADQHRRRSASSMPSS